MNRMIESYSRVHNNRYWQQLEQVFSAEDFKESTIMDLGCGPGLLLADLGKRYHPAKLIGIDLSDIMLTRAKEELEKVQSDNNNFDIELHQQHLQENPSLPIDVDFIFSSRVLRSFEDQTQTMQSIHSSLKQGGHLVLVDWTRSSIKTYDEWFKSVPGEFENLTPTDVINYHRNFSRYDLDDWKYILENHSFEIEHQFQVDTVHSCVIAKTI